MNETRRAILDALAAGPVTGPVLADELGVSRTGVWKHIDTLRTAGFDIESTPKGYSVTAVPEYGDLAIGYGLSVPYRVEYEEAVDSTNDWAREFADSGERDVVVLADTQSGGRGRLGREWHSPTGGIWMSLVIHPRLPPARVPVVALTAGVATAVAVREAGVTAQIKWPNDIVVADEDGEIRKLAGLLTEMEGEENRVSWVIIGIGVNANISSESLPSGATSLKEVTGPVNRREIAQRILEKFDALRDHPDDALDQWRSLSSTLGTAVRVDTPAGVVTGRAVDVTDVGALVIDTDDGRVTVHTGDCRYLRPV